MKNILLITSFVLLVVSCDEKNNINSVAIVNSGHEATADTSIIGTLKNLYKLQLHYMSKDQTVDGNYFVVKNGKELISSIAIKDVIKIPNKDLSQVYFTLSIKSDLVNKVAYMRQLDGKWFIHSVQYFSEYDDDPFKNGDPSGGKEIIKKSDNWREATENIWWSKSL